MAIEVPDRGRPDTTTIGRPRRRRRISEFRATERYYQSLDEAARAGAGVAAWQRRAGLSLYRTRRRLRPRVVGVRPRHDAHHRRDDAGGVAVQGGLARLDAGGAAEVSDQTPDCRRS